MKTKIIKFLFLSLASVSLAACSNSAGGYYYKPAGDGGGDYAGFTPGVKPTPEGSEAYMGDMSAPAATSAGSADASKEDGDTSTGKTSRYVLPAGQLTCSALDDNKYYDYWKEITDRGQDGDGPLYDYKKIAGTNFNSYHRVKLTVNNANDVYVTLKEDNKTFHVDNFHNAYLFAKEDKESYAVDISYIDKNGQRQLVTKDVKDNDVIDLENEYTTATNLEIMFVIDATGSMGDEMRYIKTEINDVIS